MVAQGFVLENTAEAESLGWFQRLFRRKASLRNPPDEGACLPARPGMQAVSGAWNAVNVPEDPVWIQEQRLIERVQRGVGHM